MKSKQTTQCVPQRRSIVVIYFIIRLKMQGNAADRFIDNMETNRATNETFRIKTNNFESRSLAQLERQELN